MTLDDKFKTQNPSDDDWSFLLASAKEVGHGVPDLKYSDPVVSIDKPTISEEPVVVYFGVEQ
jgi:hypothetical protein